MPDPNHNYRPFRVTSVIASLNAGGIGPVCRYAAEGLAKLNGWRVTLLSLHDPSGDMTDETSRLRVVSLGLNGNCARLFLNWLTANPQDLIITSDVSDIEPAYRFIPPATHHVVQIHDSGRRYRAVAVRHADWINGVTCVARHIEAPLHRSLGEVSFHGLLRTVHNGANFPPLPNRIPHDGPLRLLFMGRVEALKGVFDLVPMLQRLRLLRVPVTLNITGGDNETLRQQLRRKGVAGIVTWTGRVPHTQCYTIAAESDIFLMLSRKEPFGMVTIEAMSMGCVPISYDIPSGSTEILEHDKSGLLVPLGDIRAWAEKIRDLHHDRKRLAELSSGAITRARYCFNAETMSSKWADFLKDVVINAKCYPPKREPGLPPETPANCTRPVGSYQWLPAGLRGWIRNHVGACPRLSYWLLSR